jgi:sulfate adenylyltransferase
MPLAELLISEIYAIDRDNLCNSVFGTTSVEHPGVRKVGNSGNRVIGGKLIEADYVDFPFKSMTLFPEETRKYFTEKGWKTISAFQTRNIPHRGHEEIQRMALRNTDGSFINPVIGKKKAGDYTDEAILMSYKTLIEHYYPADRVLMTPLHYEMMYAGPREAVMHAIMRRTMAALTS